MTEVTFGVRLRSAVAEEVRALLARRRMTGVQLAEKIGRSQPYVSRRLTGDTAFDVDDLERVAEVLGVSVADLLPADAREPRSLRTVEGVTYASRDVNRRKPQVNRTAARPNRTAPDTRGRTGRPISRPDDHPTPNDVTRQGGTGQAVRRPRRISAALADAA